MDSNWSEEDRGIESRKKKEKQRKEEKMRQRQEAEEYEKAKPDPNCYPLSSMYIPVCEEEPPTLLRDLIPDSDLEKTTNTKQNEKEDKTEEDRRIMLELLDEENNLDYYSDSDSDYEYQTYVQKERNVISINFFIKRVKIFSKLNLIYISIFFYISFELVCHELILNN